MCRNLKEPSSDPEALETCICEDSIIPDKRHLDLTQREPFVNGLILHELVDRSLRRENLCAGMEHFHT